MTNTNYLKGFRCPKCGYEDDFFICALVSVKVTDEGPEDMGSQHNFDEESECTCGSYLCTFDGKVRDFQISSPAQKRTALIDMLEKMTDMAQQWERFSGTPDSTTPDIETARRLIEEERRPV